MPPDRRRPGPIRYHGDSVANGPDRMTVAAHFEIEYLPFVGPDG
jgi:hypothetical protein